MKNDFLSKVFFNIFIGLLITFLTGYIFSTNETLLTLIYNPVSMFFLIIAELAIAIILPVRITKLDETTAKILYYAYSALTGITFSSIFIIYELSSIIWIFLATSIIFGIFSYIGKTTKIDLSKFSVYLLIGLFSIILLGIINIFLKNNTIDMATCILGILIFIGYIAYDMQKITRLSYSNISENNLATIGAFELYLDFINLFIKLLRLFGKRRD